MKKQNRIFVVFGAIFIQLALGSIYAWSVYTTTFVESGWTKTQTQIIFSLCLTVYAFTMIIAGKIMPKIGPRKIALIGGVLIGLGYIFAGIAGATNFLTTLIFIGILGGMGIGFSYIVPISVSMRWFPDKKGLITGLAVAGFGFGATVWMSLADTLGPLGGGQLLSRVGISNTFIIYGIAYLLMISIGSIWMIFPPKDYCLETNPTKPEKDAKPHCLVNMKSKDMLKTPQFYLIFLTFVFSSSAGLMSIGLMRLWPQEALTSSGLSIKEAGAAATLAMAVFFALFNGLGRILWGVISDKIGRKKAMYIMLATQGLFIILFQWTAGNQYTLYLFAILIGFNFGGNFTLFPTLTADLFGTKYVGENYSWVFLAYAIGAILGPVMGGKLGDLGNFPLAFSICGILCFVALAAILQVKQPKLKT